VSETEEIQPESVCRTRAYFQPRLVTDQNLATLYRCLTEPLQFSSPITLV
jgi:hypothetical protein